MAEEANALKILEKDSNNNSGKKILLSGGQKQRISIARTLLKILKFCY